MSITHSLLKMFRERLIDYCCREEKDQRIIFNFPVFQNFDQINKAKVNFIFSLSSQILP